jgi:hypothetical protein
MHRRFTCDQKLGNVFSWDGLLLQYRDPVDQFMKAALELFPAQGPVPDDRVTAAAVRELADEFFGPLDVRLAGLPCECEGTDCAIAAGVIPTQHHAGDY